MSLKDLLKQQSNLRITLQQSILKKVLRSKKPSVPEGSRCLLSSNKLFFNDNNKSYFARSRTVTHYQLGVANTFTTGFKETDKSFKAATRVIQITIENRKYVFVVLLELNLLTNFSFQASLPSCISLDSQGEET